MITCKIQYMPPKPRPERKICRSCGTEFTTRNPDYKYCSECFKNYHIQRENGKLAICRDCGQTFLSINNYDHCHQCFRKWKEMNRFV